MRANVIEAAEQCGILSIAAVAEPVPLDRYLGQRQPARLLVFCDEAAEAADPLQALQQADSARLSGIDILIGPEGGFAEEERALLLRQPQDPAAFAGAADPAGGYGGRRRAGAGAGRARRLGRTGIANRPQVVKARR